MINYLIISGTRNWNLIKSGVNFLRFLAGFYFLGEFTPKKRDFGGICLDVSTLTHHFPVVLKHVKYTYDRHVYNLMMPCREKITSLSCRKVLRISGLVAGN